MLGHFDATVVAIEVLDLQLARLAAEVGKMAGALVITADHGNADEMFMHGKDGRVVRKGGSGEPMVKTSHTLNPVPFVVYDPKQSDLYTVESSVSSSSSSSEDSSEDAGVASVTATCLELLG